MPYYQDDMVTLHHGDALDAACSLADVSVQSIVTSPPYFGLRDYGAQGQMGAESSVREYVARLVALFSELRRVLKDDGTLWLNLGDSWASTAPGTRNAPMKKGGSPEQWANMRPDLRPEGITAKNLIGIPWRVAFALQKDGWVLRSEIIWSKPRGMESVRDRPSKSHETIFLLSKRQKYFYDIDATRKESGANLTTVWAHNAIPFPDAHFAVYPPELIRPCILAGSRPGDTILDPFSGSGTTGMVAIEEGRKYIGFDLNAEYLDLSLRTRFAQPAFDFGIPSGTP